jgi:hypothetical protein
MKISMEQWWKDFERRKKEVLGGEKKTCLVARFSTTNLTSTDLGSNPGLLGERMATNRLRQ